MTKAGYLAFSLITVLVISIIPLNVRCGQDWNLIFVPDDFGSIQKAINLAREGSTIIVRNGTYVESLFINKPLNLIGVGASIIGKPESNVIKINSNNVNVSGFKIIGNNKAPWAGVYIYYSTNCLIANNTILKNHIGIYIYDSSYITLKNNKIFQNVFGMRVWGLTLKHFIHNISTSNMINGKSVYFFVNARNVVIDSSMKVGYLGLVNSSEIIVKDISLKDNGEGVLVAYSQNCFFENLTLKFNERGARFVSCDKITVRNCNIFKNKWSGLTFDSCSRVLVEDSNISHNFNGVLVSYSTLLKKKTIKNMFRNNLVFGNSFGFRFFRNNLGLVETNFIVSNDVGLLIDSCHEDNVLGNVFKENGLALSLFNSIKNKFYFNSFIDNEVDVKTYSSGYNFWNLDYPFGGNYWSKHARVNQDVKWCDGLVHEPYVIDKYNVDVFPQSTPALYVNVKPYNKLFYSINIFSNVSTWKLSYNYMSGSLRFKANSSVSFFRLIMPREILYCVTPRDWHIKVNNFCVNADFFISEFFTCIFIGNFSVFHKIDFIELAGSSIFKSIIPCDVNNDGTINFLDALLILQSFGSYVGGPRWNPYTDINFDGKVDLKDLLEFILASNS